MPLIADHIQIMGHDIAGTVVEVGSAITAFKKGDRVAALAPALPTGKQAHAGFQLYTTVPERVASRIPDQVPFTDAAVLPVALTTACFGLFEPMFLGIDPPSASAPPPAENKNKVILIWGGSSSVGSCATQLCAAAGVTVLTTASPRNFEYVKALGATQVFDYSAPDVIPKIIEAAKGKEVLGAYDTISSDDTTLACARFLQELGGGKVFCTLFHVAAPQMPDGVTRVAGHPPYRAPDGGLPVWGRVWKDFMGEGLQNGKLRTKPDPFVLKGGLERLQEGIDLVRKGVSAKKIVIELEE